MTLREVVKTVKGHETTDGAGIKLVRVLGVANVQDFDPFLMLDSFDSHNPEEFTMGFPFHPHRGIETITYLLEGQMEHKDSLGNEGLIVGGESQWMTAGSGIMHQEMPLEYPWLLGVQLWLNLPSSEKMTDPSYFDVKRDMIPVVKTAFGEARILAGRYAGQEGVKPPHVKATYIDFLVQAGEKAVIPTIPDETNFIFLILGDAIIGGHKYHEKTAVLFGPGDAIEVEANGLRDLRFFFYQGKPLREPVAWGGPIVMNTKKELGLAFQELNDGNFIKRKPANV
ncbi:MAG: pirin family protein [Deltaproteobacteria bacterium]|jgi:redox-sensitive bicupin YhaK (pirin superfamily)|nr:pirin family protein [Deltaproteobacteria bacterium]